ncbi:hypothetical protein ACWEPC_15545 [Nonomuraea sp. NPDC004297]
MTVVGRVVAAGMIVAGSIVLGGSAQAAVTTGQTDSSGLGNASWRAAGSSGEAFLKDESAARVRLEKRADSSGQITSPSDGEVISNSSVTVSARTGLMQLRMGLYVDGPSTPSRQVASGGANQTLSGTFDADDVPNGTFTVTLKGEITGTRYASVSFRLRRPATAPGSVDARRQGTDKVLVTWSKGSEPDLQSYEVSNTQSGVVGRLPADGACAGSSCKAVLAVPSKAAGQRVGFTVKAFRGDGDGGSIASGDSPAAYVAFPAVPTAQPTKNKASDSARTPNDTKGVEALPTLPAKKQTAASSKPTARKPATTKLPDIPDTDPSGNLPLPAADEQSTTDKKDKDDVLAPADSGDGGDTAPVQSDGVKAQSNESPIGNIGQYGLYVAGGILLLLLGAHAGAWARRRALATGSAGGSGPPASGGIAAAAGGETKVADPHGGGGVQSQPVDGGTTRPAHAPATPSRRPAIILAVAKTRVPERSGTDSERLPGTRDQRLGGETGSSPADTRNRRPDRGSSSPIDGRERQLGAGMDAQPGGQGHRPPSWERDWSPGSEEDLSLGSSELWSAEEGTGPPVGDGRGHRPGSAAGAPSMRLGPDPEVALSFDVPAQGSSEATWSARPASPGRQPGPGRGVSFGAPGQTPTGSEMSASSGELGRWVRGEGPLGTQRLDAEWGSVAEPGDAGGVPGQQEGPGAHQGPVHIALPSSAVTDVPEAAAPTAAPAVRLEERWDDYLPPAPRSMEDSGFWERPQPGAADFWAADADGDDGGADGDSGKRDGRTQVSRRHKGAES